MDRLVRFSTGKERAAAATAKWSYALKRQRYRWTAGLTMATDVQYYNHLKMLGQASVASLAMFTNRGKIARLWTPRVRNPPSSSCEVPGILLVVSGSLHVCGCMMAIYCGKIDLKR